MMLPRPLKWIAAILLTLMVLVALVVAFMDWNWLRGPIAHRVTAATGRTFEINGDLNVHLSLHPQIIANDLVLGNTVGSTEPRMASIKRLDFRIDLLKLLSGRIELPDIALTEPRLLLEMNSNDSPNWIFTERDKNKTIDLPAIGQLTIERGVATYRDTKLKTD